MDTSHKNEQGQEHIRNAEKHLKTSLLKWRPDYDSAADEYDKAATCFRNCKNFVQCKECLLKVVDCHKQNRAVFNAAKALDQCVLVCKELGELQEIASLAERAANMFQSNGSAEKAASSLERAAKILESRYPEQALRLFQHASEIAMIQDNPRQAAEYVSKVARINVKLQQYDSAADAVRRELDLHRECGAGQAAGRLAVALVLVQLTRGDLVAAEKAFKEWGNYCDAPEVQTLEMLLQAYDEEDQEAAKAALGNPFIRNMDVEYAILARDMPLPEGIAKPPKASVRENAAPSYVSPNSQTTATIEDRPDEKGESQRSEPKEGASEDEFEGGLC